MANLPRILLYPIKSLDGVEVEKATILPGGALRYEREFAIMDAQGKFLNSKRDAKIHLLRSEFSLQERVIRLQFPGGQSPQVFYLHEELTPIEAILSELFGLGVKLMQNTNMGFPDETDSPGPRVISTPTRKQLLGFLV
jgi:uncharacterized protein YcbX